LKKRSIRLSSPPNLREKAAATAAATTGGSELPTLPSILAAISQHTSGRVAIDAAALAEAEQLERVAQELELAYASVLASMDTWQSWDDHVRKQGEVADARDVAAVAELRRRISRAYAFLAEEAAGDSAAAAAEHLRGINELIERHSVKQAAPKTGDVGS
jgi:ABC-type dipeptide/oligopeptide/nickel transport system ATPase subunit